MPTNPFLAVPIRAFLAFDGRLRQADPEFLRLHENAGGREFDVLAVPALLSLADMAMRTGMRLERPIHVADKEGDVDMWVAATPAEDGIELSILGWRDRMEANIEPNCKDDNCNDDPNTLMLDSSLLIVRAPFWLNAKMSISLIGTHVAKLLAPKKAGTTDLPLIDLLAERNPVVDLPVLANPSAQLCNLSLSPEFSADGVFLGFAGSLIQAPIEHIIPPQQPSSESVDVFRDSSFGAQLAPILRQPIDRIIANAETISGRLVGPLRENYANYAQDIANAARHLAELVSDMEDLAAIDRLDFAVAHDELELGDVARRVAGLLALKAADHQIHIIAPLESDVEIWAIAEFRRVLQIILNLLGNAIRYAPDGSQVRIRIWSDGKNACVSICDQGRGIDVQDRERVFEKFERLGRSGDGGSGLGLYISRKLARAMGGELIATSSEEGGAQFVLSLPLKH